MYGKFNNGRHPGITLRYNPENGALQAHVISEYISY